MGPRASLRLCSMIMEIAHAPTDQQNIPFILDSNCLIPDRSEAILDQGPECLPELITSARRLETAGVGLIAIACVTAHYYHSEIQASVNIPVLDMVHGTASLISRSTPLSKTGLIATSGTITSGIFEKAFKHHNLDFLLPSSETQENVIMKAIYGPDGLKAGYRNEPVALLNSAIEELVQRGADTIILGCTDISEAFDGADFKVDVIDPIRILAELAIEQWRRVHAQTPHAVPS